MTVSEFQPGSPQFVLYNSAGGYEAEGLLRPLPSGPTRTLAARVQEFFSKLGNGVNDRSQSPALLVGAVPFDPEEEDFLYQPKTFRQLDSPRLEGSQQKVNPHSSIVTLSSQQEPTAVEYSESVDTMSTLISQSRPDQLGKVVLARTLDVRTEDSVSPHQLIDCLRVDPQVTTFLTPLPCFPGEPPAWLVGATPELLVSRRGRQVFSHPLAGSIPRQADPQQDKLAADALLASEKDQYEHRFVVEAIVDSLAPLCSRLDVPKQPALRTTATMWHLGTKIQGELRDPETPVSELVAALHPTPAVCGTPRLAALEAIRQTESFERGFYSGAVGWIDEQGDGDWYVAIRCAKIQENSLKLYAGAGIVGDSVPELETRETSAKFRALLNALGISANRVE